MVVLTRIGTGRLAAIVVTLLLVLGSCLISAPDVGPHFSHAVHVGDEKLECVFCHAGVESAPAAKMPGPQICTPCHDKEDVDKPPERRLEAFFDAEYRYKRNPVATLTEDIVFSHGAHVGELGIECTACHGDVGTSDTIPAASLVTKDECMRCHAAEQKSNDCATCHRSIRRDWVPPTHATDWSARHGQTVRAGDSANMNRCSMCHERESGCQSCHQDVAPRSHTNFWRRRGHGLAVSIDRTRCATCHRTDFCSRCHEETQPMSHRGGFGGGLNRHCTGCHFPLQGTGCYTCHKGTPSHDASTPLPPDHDPAMNCRGCHGRGVRLPHIDAGHVCTTCHK